MSKLKVGDKVKVVSTENTRTKYGHWFPMLNVGDVGVISSIDGCIVNLKNNSYDFSYHIDDLELVEEPKDNVVVCPNREFGEKYINGLINQMDASNFGWINNRDLVEGTKENTEGNLSDLTDKLNNCPKGEVISFPREVIIIPKLDFTKFQKFENSKPSHYQTKNGFDVIDFCNAYNLNFNLGAVVKYTSRAGKKLYPNMNEQQSKLKDLEKALDHLQREIEFTKKEIEKSK